ncbi:glycoside hydrolase family 15 protein [Shewanella intestini]|uniref:Glucan 1,4-alpha-glucosidase n=1 Tax=Shewanella intestini TaxID=2017544 RepID=A0ABS5HZP3_9GAMM|nr:MULTISPECIES: glycoside hydrolase family 15 protein [Shewanella]MBR9727131.1 glucan 1,4-alpha-glucosidase [Shewanella intestini]MRG35933.1 glucan 1,4-alpha-glucosidase [Shewanella sp. XMDDZSB0408]
MLHTNVLNKPKKLASTIAIVLLGLNLSACSNDPENLTSALTRAQPATAAVASAPGAPGIEPTWAFSGKTGIGTSYVPYVNGQYVASEHQAVSKVWFSVAQGILTETMYGLIHNAQLKELQFIITGKDFVDTEKKDTITTIEYLHQDDQGRPLSLAYKIINRDTEGKYQIEKHIFTDPNRHSLMMKVIFTAYEEGITPHLYANPHIDNSGANDIAFVEGNALIAHTAEQDSSFMTITSDTQFVKAQAGFVGRSDGLVDLQDNGQLDNLYQTTSLDRKTVGNVALTAQLPSLTVNQPLTINVAIGFGDNQQQSMAAATQSLLTGYDAVLSAYLGNDKQLGWQDYLASLTPLNDMAVNTADNGQLLYASALVLKAQEDKTHAGALIASLSNPWGDTVSAKVGSTGYKAVWPRDFYQCAMAFLAMGDTQTPKVAFEYLKKVQVSQQTPDYQGTNGWFLQKTHVDGQIEWVGVQLDQTAMPIMLGWKLWQAGVFTDAEISTWYHQMLKPAADFLVNGGKVKLDWNDVTITPPHTQQERWEEQAGYSPSTIASVIAGLVAASDLAKLAGDDQQQYLAIATKLKQQLAATTITTQGGLNSAIDNQAYYLRISPNGNPNTNTPLLDNNGKPGIDQRQILDAGFLELVRYGVTPATDSVIKNSVKLIDNTDLEHNLRVKYEFVAKDGSTVPGYRRYGNDGYGEDTQTGNSYAENGSNTIDQRGRVWPFFTGERGHYELALAKATNQLNQQSKQQLISTYVQGMETFANAGLMLPEQAWDGVGHPTRYQYKLGDGTNSATPLAWTHAEYVKLVRSMTDEQVWDFYPIVADKLKD